MILCPEARCLPHFIVALPIQARRDAGLTQTDLANRLGQRQTFVSHYEIGRRRLDVAEVIVICRVIGVAPVELLKRAKRGN